MQEFGQLRVYPAANGTPDTPWCSGIKKGTLLISDGADIQSLTLESAEELLADLAAAVAWIKEQTA